MGLLIGMCECCKVPPSYLGCMSFTKVPEQVGQLTLRRQPHRSQCASRSCSTFLRYDLFVLNHRGRLVSHYFQGRAL